jgi:nucleotide-binding universal stress UspA family protein
MHVLIATDGHVEAEKAAPLAARLAGDDGQVTVLTAVEIPRRLLSYLRHSYDTTSGDVVILDGESVDVRASAPREHSSFPGDDVILDRYLRDQEDERTADLVAALRAAGVEPAVEARETENTSRTVLDAATEMGVDVLCIGSHGGGLFEGLLGSTGTKIARHAPCPVLIIRSG